MTDDKVVPIRKQKQEFFDSDLIEEVMMSPREMRRLKKQATLVQTQLVNGERIGFWQMDDGTVLVDYLDNVERPWYRLWFWTQVVFWVAVAISGVALITFGNRLV